MSVKSTVILGALTALLGSVAAQQVGTLQAEVHPPLTVATCTRAGGCTNQQRTIVLDSNWRWVHNVGGSTNCYTGNQWNAAYCASGTACAANCALEGANYASTYGVTTTGSAVSIRYVTGTNTGARVYLMDSTDTNYEMLKLKNREFTFDVDVSTLDCGINGALYLSEMPANGGLSSTNLAGAKYGTGYCDAQCPQDIKFINGVGNVANWTAVDANSGTGSVGACCAEMDIWESNRISNAVTPHPCNRAGLTACTNSVDCGSGSNRYNGICDKDGCDFNPYRQGNRTFYGPGSTFPLDTSRPFTVVTQYLTVDGTDTGALSEIRRFYVQNGRTIVQPGSTWTGLVGTNSITDNFCTAQKTVFGDTNSFAPRGGMAGMGQALERGMVLVMSIWDDVYVNMLWLDAVAYPTTGNPASPGIARGTCAITSGSPSATRAANPNAFVTYSNIKWGELGSTTGQDPYCSASATRQCSGTSTTTTTTSRTTTTTTTTTSPRTSTTTTTTTSPRTTTTTTTTTSPRTTTTTTTTTSPRTTTTTTTTTTSRTTTTTTSPSPSATACSARWSQCGGINWAGPFCCVSGTTCTYLNDWYYQCL